MILLSYHLLLEIIENTKPKRLLFLNTPMLLNGSIGILFEAG